MMKGFSFGISQNFPLKGYGNLEGLVIFFQWASPFPPRP